MKRALAHFVKVEDGVYGIVATAGVVQWVGIGSRAIVGFSLIWTKNQ